MNGIRSRIVPKSFKLRPYEGHTLAFAKSVTGSSAVNVIRDGLRLMLGSTDPHLLRRQKLVASAAREAGISPDGGVWESAAWEVAGE